MSVKTRIVLAGGVLALVAVIGAVRWGLFTSATRIEPFDLAAPDRAVVAESPVPADSSTEAAHGTNAARAGELLGEARPRRERLDPRRLASLRGRVLDAGDRAVPGATVEIVRRLGNELPRPPATSPPLHRERHETMTSADGLFEFTDLVRGGIFDVFARANAGERGVERRQSAGQAGEVVVRLIASTTVAGRVVDAVDGTVVPGAVVTALHTDTFETGPLDRVTTAEDGTFTIEGALPAFAATDRMGLVAIAADGRSGGESVPLVPGGRVEVTVRVGSKHVIEGIVVDAWSGDPIADAQVVFGARGPYAGLVAARTTTDGRFRIVPEQGIWEQYRLDASVVAPGYARADFVVSQGHGSPSELVVELEEGRVAIGRVVTRSGDPVRDAVVSAFASAHDHVVVGVTDARGAFRLEGLAPGHPELLFVRHDELERLCLPFPAGDGASAEIDFGEIRVGRGALVSGTVADELGGPVAHASVIVSALDASDQAQETTLRHVACDERGRFECHGLTAGRWRMRAGARGSCGGPVDVAIDLADEEIRGDVRIVVPTGRSIVGRLVDGNGRPVVHATLTLLGPPDREGAPPSRLRDEQSDERGGFRFTGLGDGPYAMTVTPRRFRSDAPLLLPARVEKLVPSADEREIVIREGALLTGIVEDEERRPVFYALVQGFDPRGMEVVKGESDRNGRFEIVVPREIPLQVIARRSLPNVPRTVTPRLDGSEADASAVARVRAGDPPLRLTIPTSAAAER